MQKWSRGILCSIGLLLIVTTTSAHPVYVSLTNFEYYPDSSIVNVLVRLNASDLEQIINYRYNTRLNFGNMERIATREQDAIEDYIHKNLIFSCDTFNLEFTFTEWSIDNENINLYFKAYPKIDLHEVVVTNRIMIDVFNEQVNMVIFNNGGNEKGLIFDKRRTMQTIVFK